MRIAPNVARFVSAGPGIPLTVVTGEAGAGKSTLLSRLLEAPQARRVAVLMSRANLGALDVQQFRRVDGDSVELAGGARCCGLDGDFASALSQIKESGARVDHVFLEVASMSELRRACGYAYMPGFRPGGIVMVIGAENVARYREDGLPDRIEEASVVVMNRLDVLSGPEGDRAQAWLGTQIAPQPLVCARNGRVAAPLFLGIDAPSETDVPLVSAQWSNHLQISATRPTQRRASERIGERCRAWSVHASQPIDAMLFRRWVDRLPSSIVRGHGVVMTTAEPHVRQRFELFGSHWGLQRDGQWRNEQPHSHLVLVGIDGELRASEPALQAVQ